MKTTVVFTFGRMSPPTIGHEKLINKAIEISKQEKADVKIFLSHSFDKKNNPIPYDYKINLLKTIFGNIIETSDARTFIEVATKLSELGYKKLVMVAGSDRVEDYSRILNKYNKNAFDFDEIKIVSAGNRDPDADDVSGISASKMRSFATKGEFEAFKNGLPKKLISNAKEVYAMTRKGMGLQEGLEADEMLVEENLEETGVLSLQQRRARGMKMRAMKSRLKMARERQKKKMASTDRLKQRAARKARLAMRARMSGGKKYSAMSSSEKVAVDRRLAKIPQTVLQRLAQRQLPIVRRAEIARLSNMRAGGSSDNSKTMQKYINTTKNEEFSLEESFDQLILELSTDLKKRYLDKAVDAHQKAFNEPFDYEKNKKYVTPKRKIKKSYYDSPEYKKGHNKLNTRRAAIQKVSKELTGKTYYRESKEDPLNKHISSAKKYGYRYNGSGSSVVGDVKIHDFFHPKLNKIAQVRIDSKGNEKIQTKHGPKQNVINHDSWKSVSNAHSNFTESKEHNVEWLEATAKSMPDKEITFGKACVTYGSYEDEFMYDERFPGGMLRKVNRSKINELMKQKLVG